MTKKIMIIVLSILILVSGLLSKKGSKKQILEQGKINVYFQGEKVGNEEYKVIEEPDGYLLEVKGNLSKPIPMRTAIMRIKVNQSYHPISFYWKVFAGGAVQEIETIFKKGEAKGRARVGGSVHPMSCKVSDSTIILPNGVVSPYILLCRNPGIMDGMPKSFHAFIPEKSTELSLELKEKKGDCYIFSLGGMVQVQVISDNGKFKAFKVPTQFFEAYEKEYDVSRSKKKKVHSIPDYVKQETFKESEVTIGIDPWQLPGTLSIPHGNGPFPAVILVHGSGPNDRDETVGVNKPFRDLAWGLASKGIMVLRYDKRTKVYSHKMMETKKSLTVKEEVIDDVLEAVNFLRTHTAVDGQRIFVLGHSLGATLYPRIGLKDSDIAGFIAMAGSTRPLEDLVLEQVNYIFSLDGSISTEEKAQLNALTSQVAKVKSNDLSVSTPAKDLPLGLEAAYWLDLRGYNPAKIALKLDKPALILQGERDYQVTMEDFKGWQTHLANKKGIVFKSYPQLNHLFMAGQGKSTPKEYLKPGHIDGKVIDDIIQWIKLQ